jgi:hypothetical protein
MITDQAELSEIQLDWAGVIAMRKRLQRLVPATFAQGAFTAPALAGVVYNLPLLHAFGVLNQTLVALRDAGRFSVSEQPPGTVDGQRQDRSAMA